MKVAIEFRRLCSAFRRETAVLTRHSQRKAQRLLSKRRPDRGPENSSVDLKRRKPDSASFSEAIRLAQQGDAAAFEFIYKHYCGRVFALCLRMLHDPAEAEDLVQEVFIQLFRKIHTYRGESAFSTWLHRLTANLVLMRLRKKKPVSISLDEITGSEEEDARPHKEIGASDPRLSGLIDRVNLQSAIDQLPAGYRQVFILYDVQGYEHSEIARLLGHSIGNSKSQYTRPVSACANCFRGCRASARDGIARQRATRSSLPPVTSPQGNLRERRNRTQHEK
jgi:RNA polymerase sigma-70 factor (ECF subfamily)